MPNTIYNNIKYYCLLKKIKKNKKDIKNKFIACLRIIFCDRCQGQHLKNTFFSWLKIYLNFYTQNDLTVKTKLRKMIKRTISFFLSPEEAI